ncbi:hypothetical protein GCM10027199_86680 [Amycolatopsis magusensis]
MNQPLKLLDRLSSLQGNEVILVYSPQHDRDFGATLETLKALLQETAANPGTGGAGTGPASAAAAYIFPPVENLAALAAIDTTDVTKWPDKWLIVVQGKGTYYLDRESAATPNGETVVAAPVGQWLAAGSGAAASSGTGAWVPDTGGTFKGDIVVLGTVTATNFIKSSDARMKERVSPLAEALGLLEQVSFYSYFLKNSPKQDYGVLAQELEETLPHLVETDAEGMKAVNYHALSVKSEAKRS